MTSRTGPKRPSFRIWLLMAAFAVVYAAAAVTLGGAWAGVFGFLAGSVILRHIGQVIRPVELDLSVSLALRAALEVVLIAWAAILLLPSVLGFALLFMAVWTVVTYALLGAAVRAAWKFGVVPEKLSRWLRSDGARRHFDELGNKIAGKKERPALALFVGVTRAGAVVQADKHGMRAHDPGVICIAHDDAENSGLAGIHPPATVYVEPEVAARPGVRNAIGNLLVLGVKRGDWITERRDALVTR